MTNDELYIVYQKLNNLEQLSGIRINHDDETLREVRDFINSQRNEAMFSAAFCIVVADILDEYLLFDDAQLLLEEALERNETDGSLDPYEYETALADLQNVGNSGYRRFHRLIQDLDNTDGEEVIKGLLTTLEEGFESADVWGMLGASYADLLQREDAVNAFIRCLGINEESRELSPERREMAIKYISTYKI